MRERGSSSLQDENKDLQDKVAETMSEREKLEAKWKLAETKYRELQGYTHCLLDRLHNEAIEKKKVRIMQLETLTHDLQDKLKSTLSQLEHSEAEKLNQHKVVKDLRLNVWKQTESISALQMELEAQRKDHEKTIEEYELQIVTLKEHRIGRSESTVSY